jgi:putative tryptophan/tyrosine transport system substrate-binding protein
MRRREFITVLGATLASWPFTGQVASARKQFLIGYLGIASIEGAPHWFEAFRDGLKENGLTVGENVRIEYRSTKSQFNEYANDLVRNNVDVIFVLGNAAAIAAKAATATIPIVFAIGGDPLALGLIATFGQNAHERTVGTYRHHVRFTPKSGH